MQNVCLQFTAPCVSKENIGNCGFEVKCKNSNSVVTM